MKFKDWKHCRDVIIDYSVLRGFKVVWKHRERKRLTATCEGNCGWRIHASPVLDTNTFQIKQYSDRGHTCNPDKENPLANYKYIGRKMTLEVKENPNMKISEFIKKVNSLFGQEISYHKALRAKRVALNILHGNWDEQYSMLRDYCATVKEHNRLTSIAITVNRYLGSPIFDCLYYSLGAMKCGFKFCRPIIGVDGCFLKTCFKGQLLSAIGRDGNDNLYPLAFAVVPIERESTWSWFFGKLNDDFGEFSLNNVSFISDRQKGLLNVLDNEFPGNHNRFCVRHLYANFKRKFPALNLRGLFWGASSTSSKNDFTRIMKLLAVEDPKVGSQQNAYEWLSSIPPEKWSRSHFPIHSKCDAVTNNMCESFNNYILEARELPIISMLENIRGKLMTRIQVKRAGMRKYQGKICPNIKRKVAKAALFSKGWDCQFAGEERYEISNGTYKHCVRLDTRECSCGMFQLSGIPCCHAMCCIIKYRKNEDDYVHAFYTKETYLKIYEHMIYPVPGKNDYVDSGIEAVLPPQSKAKVGRPQKVRIKAPDENENSSKYSTRVGLQKRCKKCLQVGHNTRTCKNEYHRSSTSLRSNDRKKARSQSEATPTTEQLHQSSSEQSK